MAIDLIEKSLEKPNRKITLTKKIIKPVCESEKKRPTKQEIETTRNQLMNCIMGLSMAIYNEDLAYFSRMTGHTNSYFVEYENNSKIFRRK